eukprot:14744128-Alexandrium_andersonii.AAC.1
MLAMLATGLAFSATTVLGSWYALPAARPRLIAIARLGWWPALLAACVKLQWLPDWLVSAWLAV